MSAKRLREVYEVLRDARLEPLVDEPLCRVLAWCPACHGEHQDPADIHRPLVVGCWIDRPTDPVRLRCYSGCAPSAIRRALTRPSIDWQAVAEEHASMLSYTLEQLDAALSVRHGAALKVAA